MIWTLIGIAIVSGAVAAAYLDGWTAGHRTGRWDALQAAYGRPVGPMAHRAGWWRRRSPFTRLTVIIAVAAILAGWMLAGPIR